MRKPHLAPTPAIATCTLPISSVTSPRARSRETEIEGQSSCVTLTTNNASPHVSDLKEAL
jgi:hypothetical protein